MTRQIRQMQQHDESPGAQQPDDLRKDELQQDELQQDKPARDRPHARRGTVIGTFKAVAWAFLGIRGRGAHEADIAKLNPVHLIIVGVVCAAVFVTSLLFIVRWAVGGAG